MTWTLHHGNAFPWLAAQRTNSVDHVITDPPYSEYVDRGQAVSGSRVGSVRQKITRKDRIGVGFLTDGNVYDLCSHTVRVARGWLLFFCAWEQGHVYADALRRAGGRYVRTCAWSKPDGTPQLTGDRPATWGECLIVGHANPAGRMRWNGGGKRGLYTAGVCRGYERSKHPTQKPLRLMRELVEDFTSVGETVMDPFAGSGSTGVACTMLGRNFVGCELSADYHAIAMRRLGGDEATARPEQRDLFASGAA